MREKATSSREMLLESWCCSQLVYLSEFDVVRRLRKVLGGNKKDQKETTGQKSEINEE